MNITNIYINIYNSKYFSLFDDVWLVFPNKNNIYFVFSEKVYVEGYYSDESYSYEKTKAESLISFKGIKYRDVECNLLLSWYNKKNNLYYIILLSKDDIHIDVLESGRNLYLLKCSNSKDGFITHNDNDSNQTDYLNVLTYSKIYIYNLENGNLLKTYDIFDNYRRFIQCNDIYDILIADKHFKILDLKIHKIITVIKSIDDLHDIKKIKHQIYGESLLLIYGPFSLIIFKLTFI